MSSFDPNAQPPPQADLIVTGPAGVEVQVLDPERRVLARGAERLEGRYPEGLYFVRWLATDAVREEIVYLKGIEQPLEVRYPDGDAADPLEGLRSVTPSPDAEEEGRSAIVVLAASNTPNLTGQPRQAVVLFDSTEHNAAFDSTRVERAREAAGQDSQSGGGWT